MLPDDEYSVEIKVLSNSINTIKAQFKENSIVLDAMNKSLIEFLARHNEQEKHFKVMEEKVKLNCKAVQSIQVKLEVAASEQKSIKEWIARLESSCSVICIKQDESVSDCKADIVKQLMNQKQLIKSLNDDLDDVKADAYSFRNTVVYAAFSGLILWIGAQWAILVYFGGEIGRHVK